MRLLNSSDQYFTLEDLGIRNGDVEQLQKLIAIPSGMIVIAGPTGSGKSTTLYALIQKIASPESKVITVEDLVEHHLPGISQVAVNESVGMTFAAALRSLLRQAPNVILVGEIRDQETAEIAIRATLTGHLLLTTVHAKDSVNAITRLLDLGVPSYLISATLRVVCSQRLVRKLCSRCQRRVNLDPNIFQKLVPNYTEIPVLAKSLNDPNTRHSILSNQNNKHLTRKQSIQTHETTGCEHCYHTGYRGRRAIMEILPITESLRTLIDHHCHEDALRQQAKNDNIKTLRDIAIDDYLQGKIIGTSC